MSRFLTSQLLDGLRVAIDQSGELLRPFERHQLIELGLALFALAARFDADRRSYFRDNVAEARQAFWLAVVERFHAIIGNACRQSAFFTLPSFHHVPAVTVMPIDE